MSVRGTLASCCPALGSHHLVFVLHILAVSYFNFAQSIFWLNFFTAVLFLAIIGEAPSAFDTLIISVTETPLILVCCSARHALVQLEPAQLGRVLRRCDKLHALCLHQHT